MKKELFKLIAVVCIILVLSLFADLIVWLGLKDNQTDAMVILLAAGMILQRLDFEDHLNHFREFGVRLIEATRADIAERFANKD
jgi:hypothetical protein